MCALFGHSWANLAESPTVLQSQIPWGFSVTLPDSQVWKSVVAPRTFLTVRALLWYNCSPVCRSSAQWLYGGVNGNLLQGDLGHMAFLPGLLQPESPCPCSRPLVADPCHHRRHSNTQRQVWLSLCGMNESWCAQGFV